MSKRLSAVLISIVLFSCTSRPVEKIHPSPIQEVVDVHPQTIEKDIDILFVIDNSVSMGDEQRNLADNFPKLIEALRMHQIGPDGSGRPCAESQTAGCRIPNLHLGVVSTDLGTGAYTSTCEKEGGDGGRLQSMPRRTGCIPPTQPYITYVEGNTNIPGDPAENDPIEQVKQAFSCIAELGSSGCGFEQTLESARRALDPKLNINPGFIRPEAYLAVVFITDEDDCSARKPQLFDPSHQTVNDPLGPLKSFRCFEFGIQCNIDDRTKLGPRKDCRPSGDWLYSIEDYAAFFKGLKSPGRVIMFAIAGPTDKVEVGLDGDDPTLKPSCQSQQGKADPAIRIKTLVDAFGKQGHFNEGMDASLTQRVPVNICSSDFSPALRMLGERIRIALGGQCLSSPPLSREGTLLCKAGDVLGKDSVGQQVTCQQDSLYRADCIVEQITPGQAPRLLPRCGAEKFADPADKACGDDCPCWRIIPNTACKPELAGSPYGLDVLRQGEAARGTMATIKCASSTFKWGSTAFAELPQ